VIKAALALLAASVIAAPQATAATLDDTDFARLSAAQIVVLGESHDNPAHHAFQAEMVDRLAPKAVIYEMLTADQAALVEPRLIDDMALLEEKLGWNASGWPDFEMYYPIFKTSQTARVYGAAVPRDAARQAMQDGLAIAFGPDAGIFGLLDDLAEDQQTAREALQMTAHCDALPANLLPAMVDVQRLRDARLAQVALQALDETGGPVVVITGNGHARTDWGMPATLARARFGAKVESVGQGEDNQAPTGDFDMLVMSPQVQRDDPCLAFRTQ
jgi:uncharacterized iron-regulated protein